MAIPIPDPVSGAIYAGPWWRHRGTHYILRHYRLHPDATPSERRLAFEPLPPSSSAYRLYQWLRFISRQW